MGAALSLATNQPFVLVFAMTDSVYSHTWDRNKVYDVRFGTIAEPQLPEDSEPYIHLSKYELVCLSDQALGVDREELGLTYTKPAIPPARLAAISSLAIDPPSKLLLTGPCLVVGKF